MSKEKQSGNCKNCNNHEEKQIEELARIIGDCSEMRPFNTCDECRDATGKYCCHRKLATKILSADYRKQEWISVDERLPEENGRYLACVDVSHLVFTSLTVIAVMEYGKEHGFYLYSEDEPVTHWMPLPEAPKMKGGAE